jgi:hypothetical protein
VLEDREQAAGPEGYEPPAIEELLSVEQREINYAGATGSVAIG